VCSPTVNSSAITCMSTTLACWAMIESWSRRQLKAFTIVSILSVCDAIAVRAVNVGCDAWCRVLLRTSGIPAYSQSLLESSKSCRVDPSAEPCFRSRARGDSGAPYLYVPSVQTCPQHFQCCVPVCSPRARLPHGAVAECGRRAPCLPRNHATHPLALGAALVCHRPLLRLLRLRARYRREGGSAP
jgi:hypothetical protein